METGDRRPRRLGHVQSIHYRSSKSTCNISRVGTISLILVEESNIFTGEPSREPLDRIRYLRNELNAVSQLQQEQIDLLDQTTRALLKSDRQNDQTPHNPYPGQTVFNTLRWQVGSQKKVIIKLTGMLDDLQSEVNLPSRGTRQ